MCSVSCTVYSALWIVTYEHLGSNWVWFSCLYCFISVPCVLNVAKPVILKLSVRTAGNWSNCSVGVPSLFPATAFLENLSVVLLAATWVTAANWITNHLIMHPCDDYHGVKSYSGKGTNPPPPTNRDKHSSRYSRRWHKAVIIYFNTLRYRMCSEGLKVTSNKYSWYWERNTRQ